MRWRNNLSILLALAGLLAALIVPAQSARDNRDQFNKDYKLSGNGAEDIVSVALCQWKLTGKALGYKGAWCAAFLSDCAVLAGQEHAIPYDTNVVELYDKVLASGGRVVTDDYKPGDLCFIDWDRGTYRGHVEVIYQISGDKIYTIGGNSGGEDTDTYLTRYVTKHAPLDQGYIVRVLRPNYTNRTLSYEESCVRYACYVTLTAQTEAALWDLPSRDPSDGASTVVCAVPGTVITATGLYLNTHGEYWYQVLSENGIQYIYAGDCMVEDVLCSDVTITDIAVPDALRPGKAFQLSGEISSIYTQIQQVSGVVRQEDQVVLSASDEMNGTAYSLKGSAIDYALTFGKLDTGWYTYEIHLKVVNHYSLDGSSLETIEQEMTIHSNRFSVGDPEIVSCDHSYALTITEPDCTNAGYTTYLCEHCGAWYTADETAALGHDWNDGMITQEPSGSVPGEKTYICNRCSASKTESIQAPGELLYTQYEAVGDFSYGYAPVMVDGKWGYIDECGRMVVRPQFDWAGCCSEGYAVALAELEDGYPYGDGNVYGYRVYLVSMAGQCRALDLYRTENGYFADIPLLVVTGWDEDAYWYEIAEGNPCLDADTFFELDALWRCCDGIVRIGNISYTTNGQRIDPHADDIATGEWEYYSQTGPCVNGIIPMCAWEPYLPFGRAFYMDRDGNVIQDLSEYTTAYAPDQGISPVENVFYSDEGEYTCSFRWGFLDSDGEWAAEPIFLQFKLSSSGVLYQEGYIPVQTEDGQWGQLDQNGELAIEAIYDDISGFHHGYCLAELDDRCFYLDLDGKRFDVLRPDGTPAVIATATKVNQNGFAAVYDEEMDAVYLADLNSASAGLIPSSGIEALRNSSLVESDVDGNVVGLDIPSDSFFIQEDGFWTIMRLENLPQAHLHSHADTVTEPTCTEGGFTTYTCACGDSYVSDETAALGHDYVKGECTICGAEDPDYVMETPFTDVPEKEWYFQPVLWAVEKGITAGTSATTFSPEQTCTRAQVVTFLWRAMGEPKPETTENPFTDVKPNAYYYSAVLWAVENNITAGTGNGCFSPDKPCTRDQVVTFLWRAMDKPEPEETNNPFVDVPENAYYHTPVLWAVENGITAGTSKTTFAPSQPCTRSQVVTFLYRAMQDK